MTREEAIDNLQDLWNEVYNEDSDGYVYAEAIDMAIEALSADRTAGWIPCSERLPNAEYGEGEPVLCCTELGLMYVLYWNGGNWCVPTGEPHEWVNHKTGWHDKVLAWMPLPNPYKSGDDE